MAVAILFPVFVHSILAAFVVYVNQHITSDFNLPSSIVPSLSIVVGLMLVFRNQTAYSRFWGGRSHLATVTTSIRCLSRQNTQLTLKVLVLVPPPSTFGLSLRSVASTDSFLPKGYSGRPSLPTFPDKLSQSLLQSKSTLGVETSEAAPDTVPALGKADEFKTIETVKILIAMLYTIKNHLRAEWGVALSPGTMLGPDGQESTSDEYKDLLPPGFKGYEHRGLGLTLELATFVEKFVAMGVQKQWFHNAASASMLSSLNALTSAYGDMEVIRLVPIPVAHLIHHKQTLALFCGILPFAMASEMDWWAVPLVAFVAFTLYGIEGIAQTYEDPFGVEKIDINMDDIVEDARKEVEVMLTAWQTQGPTTTSSFTSQTPNSYNGSIFRPRIAGVLDTPRSVEEPYDDGMGGARDSFYASGDYEQGRKSQVRFVVHPSTSTVTGGSSTRREDSGFSGYTEDDGHMEIKTRSPGASRLSHSTAVSPESETPKPEGDGYFRR
ncbi:uncharacterized protein RCO7_00644 [Rhynchosporium graminicola]|uniref:Uncharacterized protein n=1 Tax=Rhynchosporium graminicola TaxID=2792576 RepID=A0A1E1LSL4_9HELO|nr:uncharacterized protein RCO7_00644 [Rhynchosporium commune]